MSHAAPTTVMHMQIHEIAHHAGAKRPLQRFALLFQLAVPFGSVSRVLDSASESPSPSSILGRVPRSKGLVGLQGPGLLTQASVLEWRNLIQ